MTDPRDERLRRAYVAMNWIVRVSAPTFLRLVPELASHAAELASLPEITSERTLEAALPALRVARAESARLSRAAAEHVETSAPACHEAISAACEAAIAASAIRTMDPIAMGVSDSLYTMVARDMAYNAIWQAAAVAATVAVLNVLKETARVAAEAALRPGVLALQASVLEMSPLGGPESAR